LEKLLDGLGLLAVAGVSGVEWPEDVVDGLHEYATDTVEPTCGALGDTNKVVDKDIDGSEYALALRQEGISDGRLRHC
jgi:hypothetical protein